MDRAIQNAVPVHQASRASGRPIDSFVISVYVCALTLAIFVALSDQFWHWFVIPVLMAGVLIGIDAVDWARGKIDLFDPIGLSGAFGWFFFFFAPLLTVAINYWLIYVDPPAERRDWLGWMALLNLLGLMIYHGVRLIYFQRERSIHTFWKIDQKRFYVLGALGLAVTAFLQIYVYLSMGGIQGFIQEATDQRAIRLSLQGFGQIFMVSESFPIIALMMFIVYAHHQKSPVYRSWLVICVVLLIYRPHQDLFLIFGMLFAFQSNSEVMQPATCFHNHIPKFGTTETDDVVNNPIPLDIADNMFDTDANG